MIIYNSAFQEGGGHKPEERPKPLQKDISPANTGQTSVLVRGGYRKGVSTLQWKIHIQYSQRRS